MFFPTLLLVGLKGIGPRGEGDEDFCLPETPVVAGNDHNAVCESRPTIGSDWGQSNKRTHERERPENRAVLDLCLQAHREKWPLMGLRTGARSPSMRRLRASKRLPHF